MQRHAYGNTETIDLWNAWSEVSQKDIAGLMSTWTTVTGYPYLKVLDEKWSDNEVVFTLEQSRFLSDGSVDSDSTTLWSIPLLFATEGSVSEEAVIMDKKVQSFAVPLSGSGNWIKINAGQKALVRVAHSPEMIRRLSPAITNKLLGPVDRAALLLDGYALAKAGVSPLETVVDILKILTAGGEDSSIVFGAIQGVLNGFNVLMEEIGDPDVFESFVKFGKKVRLLRIQLFYF